MYFPVRAEPLRMQAGLSRLGTDFGNGEADRLLLSQDVTCAAWIAEKARLLPLYPEQNAGSAQSDAEQRALTAARDWLVATLVKEDRSVDAAVGIAELGAGLAEDFVVVHAPEGQSDRAVWVHAYFPSGWRPQDVLGSSFLRIHARVPEFGQVERAASQLVEGMVTRGPYVRFVWTIAADSQLDHHPEHGGRAPWSSSTARAFLRVERQTTVPLPAARAAIFLIRTYLYDFDELSGEHRATLASALELMPAAIRQYKQLDAAVPRALELLRR